MPPARAFFHQRPRLPWAAIAWMLLLLAPAATTLSAWHSWDIAPARLFIASAGGLLVLRLACPPLVFHVLTYPIALFGVACIGADVMRNVNLIELAAQWRTFSAGDVADALHPYRGWLALAAIALAAMCALAIRASTGPSWPLPRRWLAAVALGGALGVALPSAVWAHAWPANGVLVAAAMLTNQPQLAAQASLATDASPRAPQASWHGALAPGRTAAGVYVFLIGDSVRPDDLEPCGGRRKVRALHDGALLACDVVAGATATHTSVPLLVSRELPGIGVRVPADGTFQRAFAEAGFATYWFGMQDESVAWPDAGVRRFPEGVDRAVLPLLQGAIDKGTASVVLHTMGAHSPYCPRFDPRSAPYPSRCDGMGDLPGQATLDDWRLMYANAVDDSFGLVNDVIERLAKLPGEAFFVYTSDHGENLMDDSRRLFGHALRVQTRWDAHVPAVFWANDAWKAAHPGEWQVLQRNAARPLVHADLVPTLLHAAGVRYDEPRASAVDLLARDVGPRQRLVQKGIGETVPWETLLQEAVAAGPLH